MKQRRFPALTQPTGRPRLSPHRYPFLVLCALLALGALLSVTPTSDAQKPGVPLNPAAPGLAMPSPTGMQRGTTLELLLTGTNLAEPVALLSSIPGLKAVFPTDNNNGKEPAKLRVQLEVPKESPIGYYGIRLATKRGISNLRLFCIDELPGVLKEGTNKSRATAQKLPVPCVVAGRVDAESSDYYKITVQAGQRLSFDLLGRRLASVFDPQLTIIDPKNLREIAYNQDSPGAQTDPRLTHTFKEAGEFLVEIRDVMHRGGPDFHYRLRIGDFPIVSAPIPMAAKRGSKVAVQFAGPFVNAALPVEVTMPSDPAVSAVWVAPKGPGGLHGWPVALASSDIDEVVEQEPNNDIAKANRVPVPGAVSGRIQDKGDIDYFVFNAKKGKLTIEAHTLEFHSPAEVYLAVKDSKGADLAKTSPLQAPRIDFNVPNDGDYYLAVEHLHQFWGGPSEGYRITLTPSAPGFEVVLATDRLDIPQGSAAALPILAITRRDYSGPIELTLLGNPGLTGTKVLPGGPPAAAPKVQAARMVVTASPSIPMGAFLLRVQAKAKIDGKDVVSYASVRPALSQALGNLPFPPRDLFGTLAVGVSEKPPFTLVAKFDQPEVLRGGTAGLTITTTRSEGFDGDIALALADLPPPVVPAVKALPPIAKGQTEVKIPLTVPAKAPLGEFPISFTGKAKHQNRDYNVIGLPVNLNLSLPFDLKVEPAPLKLNPGDKGKIKVSALRKGGYKGPIALEVRGLPAGVTAPKLNIDQDKNDVEVEVTAAANAAAGDKADVNVLGTAPAAANEQNASPNFTISINKK